LRKGFHAVDSDKQSELDYLKQEIAELKKHIVCAYTVSIFSLFVFVLFFNGSFDKYNINTLTVGLTFLQIFLGVIAIGGFWIFKGVVTTESRRTAKLETPSCVKEVFDKDGYNIIEFVILNKVLADPEFLSKLQANFRQFGLEDTDDAIDIDEDPDWKPEDE